MRIVDGNDSDLPRIYDLMCCTGPKNTYITQGRHASAFAEKLEKTHYLGLVTERGQVWQAKG
jgi:hypothetical protein